MSKKPTPFSRVLKLSDYFGEPEQPGTHRRNTIRDAIDNGTYVSHATRREQNRRRKQGAFARCKR